MLLKIFFIPISTRKIFEVKFMISEKFWYDFYLHDFFRSENLDLRKNFFTTLLKRKKIFWSCYRVYRYFVSRGSYLARRRLRLRCDGDICFFLLHLVRFAFFIAPRACLPTFDPAISQRKSISSHVSRARSAS